MYHRDNTNYLVNLIKINALSLIFCLLIFSGVASASIGVFNHQITPNEILTNTAANIKVSAEIGTDVTHPLIQSSVVLYETDATGKPIRSVGRMYDDGTHGDALASDTIFTLEFVANEGAHINRYFIVTAAYTGVRNRYQSPVMEYVAYPPLPEALVPEVTSSVQTLQTNFNSDVASIGLDAARQRALADAISDPHFGPGNASLSGNILSLMYVYSDPVTGYTFTIPGIVFLVDPNNPTDGAGRSVPINLPVDYKGPGNDKLLIFAPGYNNADPQRGIADHAQSQFNNTEYMTFDPDPPLLTEDENASLEVIKHWGDYGTVIMHTHGGLWSLNGTDQVVLLSGTPATLWNQFSYMLDLITHRIGIAGDGRFVIYPSFITAHASAMKNTFFYLGACESLRNNTMWNVLMAKGAKVAFGWSQTVNRQFNTDTFARLIDPMLPHTNTQDPLTAILV